MAHSLLRIVSGNGSAHISPWHVTIPSNRGNCQMLEQLRLERIVASRREKVLCAICDRDFTPHTIAELLYAGGFPVGFLCPECFSSPRQAAACARRRASTIRSLAREARDTVSRPDWLTLLHLAHSRANYWEGLAARIENLNSGNWKQCFARARGLVRPTWES
jgi:hypothetical protein